MVFGLRVFCFCLFVFFICGVLIQFPYTGYVGCVVDFDFFKSLSERVQAFVEN